MLAPSRTTAAPDDAIAELGETLVIAPHPGDESIGCGGLVARLCDLGLDVWVLLLSDGTASHPNSRRYSPGARRALRWSEMRDALAILGVDAERASALGWPDGALPGADDPGFEAAVEILAAIVAQRQPSTVLVPAASSSDPDHRAAADIVAAVRRRHRWPLRILAYEASPDSLGTLGGTADGSGLWRVDIAGVVERKVRAAAAHRSQWGGVIDDDPGGRVLPGAALERCAEPQETYVAFDDAWTPAA